MVPTVSIVSIAIVRLATIVRVSILGVAMGVVSLTISTVAMVGDPHVCNVWNSRSVVMCKAVEEV